MTTNTGFDLSARRVVYDVNVYIDAAAQVGPAFAWGELPAISTTTDHSYEESAALALSIVGDGRFAGPLALELWTSEHITDLMLSKLRSELGWTVTDAEEFTQEMLDQAYRTKGAELTVGIARQSPPLDNEDGLVFATAVAAQAQYLVSNDAGFDAVDGRNGVQVMTPEQWVRYVQHWRKLAGK